MEWAWAETQTQTQTEPKPNKRKEENERWPARPSSTMAPLAAADAFLVLEFLVGNRRVPLPVLSALIDALPSVSPHTSPRLRKGVALRALDAALSDSDAAGADADVLLRKARAVLAYPDLAPCFPDQLAVPDDLAAFKRFVDAEWAALPPSALEATADRIVGAGALDTWANADQDTRRKLGLLVGESTEREILGKLGQDPSKVPLVHKAANAPSASGANEARRAQVDKPANAPSESSANEAGRAPVDKAANVTSTSGANEADRAQQDEEAHLGRENGRAGHVQEDCARRQQEPVERTKEARLPEKSVTSAASKGKDKASSSRVTEEIAPGSDRIRPVLRGSSKPSFMERNPTASVYEWDDSFDSDTDRPPRKRQLPTYERKPRPPPAFPHRTRKKWTELQEKTLMEGVATYGKGNWTNIKTAYPAVFADRSTVDLKDKFRNMERYAIN